jgi:peptidoglycan/xylan/chitin deacetylase (PgdA/CDA1 family)
MRLTVSLLVSLEQVEWEPPPPGTFVPPSARGTIYPAAFDPTVLSLREYGNRVGVFRVLRVLERVGLRATVAVDALLAEWKPSIVRACHEAGHELAGRGLSASRMVTELMPEDEERGQIRRCLDAVEAAGAPRPVGWVSPDYGESSRTPRLLVEAGVRYVCDWPSDERPYALDGLVSLPVALDLDDLYALKTRALSVGRWERAVLESAERMGDGLLVLHVHPWVIGQPFRIRYLERALVALRDRDVRFATGAELA